MPFSSIPGQNKLFLQYLDDPLSLKRFYPSAVRSISDLPARRDEVLAAYTTDRGRLCDALERQNWEFGSGPEAAANIQRLRDPGTVAVLTGQQTGFLTGPLYTIYKALTALKAAECLTANGVDAVAVFWMATEDHDLEEVSNVFVVDTGGRLVERFAPTSADAEGLSVGRVRLNAGVETVLDEVFSSLPSTEFSGELRRIAAEAWRPGGTFGQGFGSMLASLLGRLGLVIVDPLDPEIKQLASPIYAEAIQESGPIVEALSARSADLAKAGYEPQVLVEDDHFPLFWHTSEGVRTALRRRPDGTISVKAGGEKFTEEELAALAVSEPDRLSPGVMLRPTVQDFLFPTICYFGGGAEVAYFAQNSEVYRSLGRPVTPIFHRQSFTAVEARHARTMEKFGSIFTDLFAGYEAVLPHIVDKYVDPDAARVFADVEERINTELRRLDELTSKLDVSLAANLATRRRKIIFHLAALRDKYRRRRVEVDEMLDRRLSDAFNSLYPNGNLQERAINVVSLLDRCGPAFIDTIYDAIDLDDRGHRIVYL